MSQEEEMTMEFKNEAVQVIEECVNPGYTGFASAMMNYRIPLRNFMMIGILFKDQTKMEKFRRFADSYNDEAIKSGNEDEDVDSSQLISRIISSDQDGDYKGSEVNVYSQFGKKMNDNILKELRSYQHGFTFQEKDFDDFYKAAEEFFTILAPQHHQLCSKFVKSVKNFDQIYKYQFTIGSTQFNMLDRAIKNLPDYKRYREYLGTNFHDSRIEFCQEVLQKIFKNLEFQDVQKVQYVIQRLQDNPLYNFMKDPIFSFKEKEILYQILWETKYVMNLANITMIPESIQSQIFGVLESFMKFIKQIDIPSKNNEQIAKSILTIDQKRLYSINAINTEKTAVFKFFQEKFPEFFYLKKRDPKLEGITKYKIETILLIRNKLHELKVSHESYDKIQELILSNNVKEIYKENLLNIEIAKQIILFVKEKDEIQKYLKLKFERNSSSDYVIRRVIKIMMEEMPQNMTFDNMLEYSTYYSSELSLPEGYLGTIQVRKLKERLEKDELIARYIKDGKIDIEKQRSQIDSQLFYYLSSIPDPLNLLIMQNLIKQFKQKNNKRVFLESKLLTEQQKQDILSGIDSLEAVQRYKKIFSKYQAIESKNKIRRFFSQDLIYKVYLMYIEMYGEVRFNPKDGNMELEDFHGKQILKGLAVQLIKNIQDSSQFKDFQRNFSTIFACLQEESENKMIKTIEELGYKKGFSDDLLKMQIKTLKMNNYSQEKNRDSSLINDLLSEQTYKSYIKMQEVKQKNQLLIAKIHLENYLEDELRNHKTFRRYEKDEKIEFIKTLKSGIFNLISTVNSLDILLKEKTELIENLSDLQLFKDFQEQLAKGGNIGGIGGPIHIQLFEFLKDKSQVFKNITEDKAEQLLNRGIIDTDSETMKILGISVMNEKKIAKEIITQYKEDLNEFIRIYGEANPGKQSQPKKQEQSPVKKQERPQLNIQQPPQMKSEEKPQNKLSINTAVNPEVKPNTIPVSPHANKVPPTQQQYEEIKNLFREKKISCDAWTNQKIDQIMKCIPERNYEKIATQILAIKMGKKKKQFIDAIQSQEGQFLRLAARF